MLTPLPLPCSGHTAVHAHTAQVSLPSPDVTLKRVLHMALPVFWNLVEVWVSAEQS